MGCNHNLCLNNLKKEEINSVNLDQIHNNILSDSINNDISQSIIQKQKEIDLFNKNQKNKFNLLCMENNKENNILLNDEKNENQIIICNNSNNNMIFNMINNSDNKNDKKPKLQIQKKKLDESNLRINKVKTISLLPLKNIDNNKNYEKIIDALLQKEIQYKLQLKKYEDIIADYREPILVGLNNIGATCYMNATLQCLSNTKKLTEYFLKEFKYDNPNKKMTYEYYKVIKNLWNRDNNNKSYSPNSFKEVLSQENELFAGIQANDSKDLINFLIERFHQELNLININQNDINQIQEDQLNEANMLKTFIMDFRQKFNSPISNLFYGILETKSQCQGCQIIKYNFQLYSFLEFPLEQVNIFFNSKFGKPLKSQNGKNSDIDIYECFEYNRKIDLMNGQNQMYCDRCNKLCDSNYTTLIYSGPNYLIINLNRGKGAVYECNVIFPEQLNIINFLSFKQGITVYELYAVICHLGPSSMSGHFVAYCKNSVDHKWYLYNDAFVTLCTKPQQYNDGMPYILFYKAAVDGT